MNRPHNYAESAYFIHQRYEDTALVIFQQLAKKKKETKKSAQHPGQAYSASLAQPKHYAGTGQSPGKTSVRSVPDNTDHGQLPSPNWNSSGPAVPAAASSAPEVNDSIASSRLGVTGNSFSSDTSLTSGTVHAAVDPALDHTGVDSSLTRSDLEDASLCGSIAETPLQTSVHSDVTLASENTTSVSSATHSDTSVHPSNLVASGINQDTPESEATENQTDPTLEQAQVNNTPAAGEVNGADRSPVADGVSPSSSGVEFGHYGSSGVVARRRVAMTKSDSDRIQSRVCVLM